MYDKGPVREGVHYARDSLNVEREIWGTGGRIIGLRSVVHFTVIYTVYTSDCFQHVQAAACTKRLYNRTHDFRRLSASIGALHLESVAPHAGLVAIDDLLAFGRLLAFEEKAFVALRLLGLADAAGLDFRSLFDFLSFH